jgi:hypothetical protein
MELSVEKVQDIVEEVLMTLSYPAVKAYIKKLF